jgi:hypothetical protein
MTILRRHAEGQSVAGKPVKALGNAIDKAASVCADCLSLEQIEALANCSVTFAFVDSSIG